VAHRGCFHELGAGSGLPPPDAFVLFNPGIAHPVYGGGWEPSIRLALAWQRPMLFTSFDEQDCADDMAALHRMASAAGAGGDATLGDGEVVAASEDCFELTWLQEPHANAFASLKFDAHQQDEGRMVRSNHSAFVVHPRRKQPAANNA